MEKVIIIGASGHGKVIADILEQEGTYNILGYLDSFKKPGTKILNYKVLGGIEHIPKLIEKEGNIKGIVGIGDNWTRKKIVEKVTRYYPDFSFLNAIHPMAIVSKHATLGIGVVVIAGSVINAGANIGNHSIINTKSSIGHDTKIYDFSSIAPGVTIGGNCLVGELTAISIGAIIKNNVSIGNNTLVGAGSVVLENIKEKIVAYGYPAKYIREFKVGETYL